MVSTEILTSDLKGVSRILQGKISVKFTAVGWPHELHTHMWNTTAKQAFVVRLLTWSREVDHSPPRGLDPDDSEPKPV